MISYKKTPAVTGLVAAIALIGAMSEAYAGPLGGQNYRVSFAGYSDCYHFLAGGVFNSDLRGIGGSTERFHQKVLATKTHYVWAGLSGSGIAYGGSGEVLANHFGLNAKLVRALEVDENGITSGAAFGSGPRVGVCSLTAAAAAAEGDIPGQ